MKYLGKVALAATLLTPFTGFSASDISGKVKIDGSSTVFPITEAVAEEFRKEYPKVRVSVGVSGTGGGFKKFLNKETDINDASRLIKGKEKKIAKEKGIEFIELPIAYDGISVIINPKNEFAKNITFAELKKIWEPGSKVKTWKDVNAKWPNEPIKLYGPGPDSGTFDYFTEAVMGKSKASRSDFTASEDDNVIIKGVTGDKNGMGYLGYAYYIENKSKVKAANISKDAGPVAPNAATIESGEYPLARPIFIYVSTHAAKKKQVEAFVNFYLKAAPKLSKEVGYVPLSEASYNRQKVRFSQRKVGSAQSH